MEGRTERSTASSNASIRASAVAALLAAVLAAVLAALPGAGSAFADETGGGNAAGKTIRDGIYTEAQAEAGEELYARHCLTCHDKKYFRPVLKTWSGQPLGVLYTMMSASMPQSNPGSLPRQDYVDILAYILSLNRYPAGDSELDYEDGALDEITIVERD